MATSVAVNLLWLVPGVVGGSEELLCGYLRGIRELEPEGLHMTLFVQPSFTRVHPELASSFATIAAPARAHSRANRIALETTWLERRTRGFDVVHHAGGVVPRASATATLLTLHDLQPLDLPANFRAVKRRWLSRRIPRSIEIATAVHVTSEFVAAGVRRRFSVEEERLHVIPPVIACEDVTESTRAEARSRYGLHDPYILYPAISYAHKNHETLINAFAQLRRDGLAVDLVLPGGTGPAEHELLRHAAEVEGVRRLGRIPRADLEALLVEAAVLAFPSAYEGFGLPVLEAMTVGCPTVVADAGALPDVIDDAGLCVSTYDVDAWTEALRSVLVDESLRQTLIDSGRTRAAAFSPSEMVGRLVELYRDLGRSTRIVP